MMSYVPLGLIACVVTAGYSLKYRRPWFWRIVYVIVTFGGSLHLLPGARLVPELRIWGLIDSWNVIASTLQ